MLTQTTTLRRLTGLFAVLVGIALLVYETISLSGAQGSDFAVFYDAVQRTMADPATMYLDSRGVAETARSLQGFLYPPPSIMLLWPIGMGSSGTGFLIISWGALIAAAWAFAAWLGLLRREGVIRLARIEYLALIALALATGPVFANRLGQVDTLILALCVGGVLLSARGHPAWGAALLAVGAWTKIYPALLMVPLLLNPRQRLPAFTGFAVGALLTACAAAAFIPLSVWQTYAFDMLPAMSSRTIINIDNQSLVADFVRLNIDHAIAHSSYDTVVVPAMLRMGIMLAGLVIIAAMQLHAHRYRASPLLVQSVTLAVICLIAPLGWGHSYAYALPLLIAVAALAIHHRRWITLLLAAGCWVALLIPAHRQFPFLEEWPHAIWWLVHSRYALAVILLIGLAFWLVAHAQPHHATNRSNPS